MSLLHNKNTEFNVEQETESMIGVMMGSKNPSLVITVCHHAASLVVPNGDPRGRIFNPTITLMIDFYIFAHQIGVSAVSPSMRYEGSSISL